MERDKVIKALEVCRSADKTCEECPYNGEPCVYTLNSDALALLKEQEHGETFTVIDTKTGKEADTYNIALHEEWAKHLCYCDMDGWALQDDGSLLLLDECGRYAYADRERFKVVWDA